MTRISKQTKFQIVRSILADIPVKYSSAAIREKILEAAINELPNEIRKIWDNPNTRNYVKLNHIGAKGFYAWVPSQDNDWKVPQSIVDMIEQAEQESKDRESLRLELKANIDSVLTVKQFQERFPDLVRYLPEDKKAAVNLPASTHIIDRLKIMGLKL